MAPQKNWSKLDLLSLHYIGEGGGGLADLRKQLEWNAMQERNLKDMPYNIESVKSNWSWSPWKVGLKHYIYKNVLLAGYSKLSKSFWLIS